MTLQYGLAEDTLRTGGSVSAQEVSPNELYSQSAIYIAAAHALKPNYSVRSHCLFVFSCTYLLAICLFGIKRLGLVNMHFFLNLFPRVLLIFYRNFYHEFSQ
jgi:hypothetical protein